MEEDFQSAGIFFDGFCVPLREYRAEGADSSLKTVKFLHESPRLVLTMMMAQFDPVEKYRYPAGRIVETAEKPCI